MLRVGPRGEGERLLLSLRSVVLMLAVLVGAGAGVLTRLAGEGAARSALCGLTAIGLAVPFFNHLIGSDGLADEEWRSERIPQGGEAVVSELRPLSDDLPPQARVLAQALRELFNGLGGACRCDATPRDASATPAPYPGT